MQSIKRIFVSAGFFIMSLLATKCVVAQENSPFSRYGLGDLYPNENMATRGMGGVSAAFSDRQMLNTINPASYSALSYVKLYGGSRGALISYDVGFTIDARTLRDATSGLTYKSTNFIPSYILIGVPLSSKADNKNRNVGLVFGLQPYTRINYSIEQNERTNIDSLQTLYEGSGGLNNAFLGLSKKWGNLSLGANFGYSFGQKDIDTKKVFINDTVNYYKSNSENKTTYGGFYVTPGFSYTINLKKIKEKNSPYTNIYYLRLGASATLAHTLTAKNDTIRNTFVYDPTYGTSEVDSVYKVVDIKGNIDMPLVYNAGFMIGKKLSANNVSVEKWSFGVDYSAGKWNDYRFYGKQDRVTDNWMLKAGAQIVPSLTSPKFFGHATYRLGFYTGRDYINADGNQAKISAFTLGFGFNVKRWTSYDNQSTVVNTALEFGKRGSGVNNVTENFFRFSVGLSLADLWFIRRKYD